MKTVSYGVEGATVLITGGAGVLGGKIAVACLEAGARVIITSRTLEKAQAAAESLRKNLAADVNAGDLFPAAVDAESLDSLQTLRDSLPSGWNTPQVLINCAGGNFKGEFVEPGLSPFTAHPESIWEAVEKNLRTVINTCFVFGPLLLTQKWSSIINLGSMTGIRPLPGIGGYNASKAGLHNYTVWLAQMLGLHTNSCAHRANAIAFGFALGEQNTAMLQNGDGSWKPRGGAIASMHPAGQWGAAEDAVSAALLLASPTLGGAINGSVMVVDRGFQSMSLPRYGDLAVS